MTYPDFPRHMSMQNLNEHFTLTQPEIELLSELRTAKNKIGFSTLLKTSVFLGYPPTKKSDVPNEVVAWIGNQLAIDPLEFSAYVWQSSTFWLHLSKVRQFTHFRPYDLMDGPKCIKWLLQQGSHLSTFEHFMEEAIQIFRKWNIGLPSKSELLRLVSSARNAFLHSMYDSISSKIALGIKTMMDQSLTTHEKSHSKYHWLKSKPGRMGMKTLMNEIDKLTFIRQFHIVPEVLFKNVSDDHLLKMVARVDNEDAHQVSRHNRLIIPKFNNIDFTDYVKCFGFCYCAPKI